MDRLREVDWETKKKDSFNLFTKLIRTKDPNANDNLTVPSAVQRTRLSKCLTTSDLISLGVGSCVGTGMYLVTGMVARTIAGPGVVFSFIIAAGASILSGACYAEFGVRVPNTTGSAYMYSYVSVGEFVAFVIGWNMSLEYLIGTSACSRALSACFDSIAGGAISQWTKDNIGSINGEPPDLLAFFMTLGMTLVLLLGVKKSLMFNNVLNIINFGVWVFIMSAGMFYINCDNWTRHKGFLPYGWSGVCTGAATCFYAFIGFDIIATTGEEANNPKRSIPLAIVGSLLIILCAYVTTSMMLTLIVPYDSVDQDSALVAMFGAVGAPTCQFIVALGAVAGLTVSMFGSMFPMPRIIYAMAQDGLIFRPLALIWESTGTPAVATCVGGFAASVVALFIRLEILVEMMSIGTLLAYTLVSACVLILRYQPNPTNLIELLPQRLRTPIPDVAEQASTVHETRFGGFPNAGTTRSQRVMIRRVTRSSPDSDDSLPVDDMDDYGRDDQYLVSDNNENNFYGSVHGTPGATVGSGSRFGTFFDFFGRKLHALTYLCPGLFPWVDPGPATEMTGMFVIRCVGVMFGMIMILDLIAAYGTPSSSTATTVTMVLLLLAILLTLVIISKKPQNRNPMLYTTPGLPFVPSIAVMVNIYLTLNLSILTLVRFTVWMSIGLVVYFKYGIKNSTLEQQQSAEHSHSTSPQPTPSVLSHKVIPPRPSNPPAQSRTIFEGDLNEIYGAEGYRDPLLAWEEAGAKPSTSSSNRVNIEQRFNERTNRTSSHAMGSTSAPAVPAAPAAFAAPAAPAATAATISRPPWAHTDYPTWND